MPRKPAEDFQSLSTSDGALELDRGDSEGFIEERQSSLYEFTLTAARAFDRLSFAPPPGRRPNTRRSQSWRRSERMVDHVTESLHEIDDLRTFGMTSEARPIVVVLLVVACVVVFIFEMRESGWSLAPTDENLFFGPSIDALEKMGGKIGDKILDEHQHWRLLTANFLHAGIVHLVLNMLSVVAYGLGIERAYGHWPLFVVVIISGVFSFTVSTIFSPHMLAVGLSGSIAGLLGSVWAHLFSNWHQLPNPCFVLTVLFCETCVSLVVGICPFVDNFCHLSGFYFGLLAGLAVYTRPDFDEMGCEQPVSTKKQIVKLLAAVTAVLSFLIAMYWCFVYADVEDNPFQHCAWCRHMTCVEFPVGSDDPWWHCGACYMEAYSFKALPDGKLKVTCPASSENIHVVVDGGWANYYHEDETYGICEKYCETWY